MISASAYILIVPKNRRELILRHAEDGPPFFSTERVVAEPVPRFQHSMRAPLIVFASFEVG
jgi:hypothetical protein